MKYKIVKIKNDAELQEYDCQTHEVNFKEHMILIYQKRGGLVGVFPIQHFYLVRENE